jgi:glycosyltransferase involved in cell wall biosynthesis
MRVVYVLDSHEYYGATESFISLVRDLSEKGLVEPIILTCKEGRISRFSEEHGFEHYSIGHQPFYLSMGTTFARKLVRFTFLPLYWLRYKIGHCYSIKKAIRNIDFSTVDVIHTNVNRNDVGYELAVRFSKPHVWHIREFGNDDYMCVSLRSSYVKAMNDSINSLVAVSDAVKGAWIKRGISEERIRTIYNGISAEKFRVRNEENDRRRYVMCGSICPSKGQSVLVDALALLPESIKREVVVDFYGDGPKEYIICLKNRIKKLGLNENIRFMGFKSDLENYLPQYDVGFMCSRSEAFGRITVEYMMSGVIPVVSDRGGNTEIVTDGINGFVFDYDRPANLAMIIERIETGMDLRMIREDAIRVAKGKFSQEINSVNIMNLYKHVIDQK